MDKIDKIIRLLSKIEKRIDEVEKRVNALIPEETNTRTIDDSTDPLLPDAINYILEKQSVNSADLQEFLDIGYARTQRILDELCELGFIEEFDLSQDTQIIKKDSPASNKTASTQSQIVEAVKLVKNSETISAAMLQRKLKIGYARAAAILDELEELGYIAAAEGSRPRKVLHKNRNKTTAKN